MGKFIGPLIILFFLIGCSETSSQNNKKSDFGTIHWGMSSKEVATIEKSTLLDIKGTMFSFEMKFINKKKNITIYNFINDKLIRFLIIYAERSNAKSYIDAYFQQIEALSKKYGKPTESDLTWNGGDLSIIMKKEFKNRRDVWPNALQLKMLKFKTIWKTSSSVLVLGLFNDEKISFGLICEDNIILQFNDKVPKENHQQDKYNLKIRQIHAIIANPR